MCLKGFAIWCAIAVSLFSSSHSSVNSNSLCVPFANSSGLAKLCGYEATANFTHDSHYFSAARAIRSISKLVGSCSEYVNQIICSVYIPRCESNINGPYLPCRRVCDEVYNKCENHIGKYGLEWIIGMCQLLPKKDNPNTKLGYLGRCFEPPNFKTKISYDSEPDSLECHPLVVPICKDIGYKTTVLSEQKQRAYISYADRKLVKVENETARCSLSRKRFFCTENFPACIDEKIAFYCRKSCLEFFAKNCSSPFFYKHDMCMEFPEGKSSVDICKQTHWPRAQNWPAVRQPPTPLTPVGTTKTSGNKDKDFHARDTEQPKVNVKQQSGHKTNVAPIVGGVVAALVIIALAVILAYIIYKKKIKETYPYDKQILYADDSIDI